MGKRRKKKNKTFFFFFLKTANREKPATRRRDVLNNKFALLENNLRASPSLDQSMSSVNQINPIENRKIIPWRIRRFGYFRTTREDVTPAFVSPLSVQRATQQFIRLPSERKLNAGGFNANKAIFQRRIFPRTVRSSFLKKIKTTNEKVIAMLVRLNSCNFLGKTYGRGL